MGVGPLTMYGCFGRNSGRQSLTAHLNPYIRERKWVILLTPEALTALNVEGNKTTEPLHMRAARGHLVDCRSVNTNQR